MKICIKNKIQYTHADINECLESLTMQPSDWKILDIILDSDEYREVVLEYQEREKQRLPSCTSLFAVCRNFDNGKCTSHTFCSFAQ